ALTYRCFRPPTDCESSNLRTCACVTTPAVSVCVSVCCCCSSSLLTTSDPRSIYTTCPMLSAKTFVVLQYLRVLARPAIGVGGRSTPCISHDHRRTQSYNIACFG
ncbi:unnamed protein product, partial [Ectocarpus sp. 4 AP-2014]